MTNPWHPVISFAPPLMNTASGCRAITPGWKSFRYIVVVVVFNLEKNNFRVSIGRSTVACGTLHWNLK